GVVSVYCSSATCCRVRRTNLIPDTGNESRSSIRNTSGPLEHHEDVTRSSFNRMFTKLYGGQGPVYLNLRLIPYFLAILFTTRSNSYSRSRSTRTAAFIFILSPMSCLSRVA